MGERISGWIMSGQTQVELITKINKKNMEPMANQAKQLANSQSQMALIGLKPRVEGGESEEWSAIDVTHAVNDIADMCERTMINFVALGEFGKAIRDKVDDVALKRIQIGFSSQSLTPEVKSLFKTWNFADAKYGYKYFFSPPTKWDIKIPVEIHIFKKSYKFLVNPDRGWYGVNDFLIPNPFAEYWRVRGLI